MPQSIITERVSVVLVKKSSGKPIGSLVADASRDHAKAFIRHFNRGSRKNWPDRKAVAIPVI